MERSAKNTPQVDEVRPYLQGVAKHLLDRLYGAQGPAWGTSLTQIETVLLEVRDLLARELIDSALRRQALAHSDAPTEYQHCPTCKRPLRPDDEPNPRITQTQLGEANWPEPQAYCDRCRRSFFPSIQEPRS